MRTPTLLLLITMFFHLGSTFAQGNTHRKQDNLSESILQYPESRLEPEQIQQSFESLIYLLNAPLFDHALNQSSSDKRNDSLRSAFLALPFTSALLGQFKDHNLLFLINRIEVTNNQATVQTKNPDLFFIFTKQGSQWRLEEIRSLDNKSIASIKSTPQISQEILDYVAKWESKHLALQKNNKSIDDAQAKVETIQKDHDQHLLIQPDRIRFISWFEWDRKMSQIKTKLKNAQSDLERLKDRREKALSTSIEELRSWWHQLVNESNWYSPYYLMSSYWDERKISTDAFIKNNTHLKDLTTELRKTLEKLSNPDSVSELGQDTWTQRSGLQPYYYSLLMNKVKIYDENQERNSRQTQNSSVPVPFIKEHSDFKRPTVKAQNERFASPASETFQQMVTELNQASLELDASLESYAKAYQEQVAPLVNSNEKAMEDYRVLLDRTSEDLLRSLLSSKIINSLPSQDKESGK